MLSLLIQHQEINFETKKCPEKGRNDANFALLRKKQPETHAH